MPVTRETVRLAHRSRRRTGVYADRAVATIGRNWNTAWRPLEQVWARAATSITDTAARDGRWPRPWELARIPDLRDALDATSAALDEQQRRSTAAVVAAISALVPPVLAAEAAILASQWPTQDRPGLADLFARNLRPRLADLIAAAVAARATAALAPLATDTYRNIERVVTRGVRQRDPAQVAATLTSAVQAAFTGGANRAATVARTETVDAHRDAAATFRNGNLQTITGWVWASALSRDTCPACWVMHGTVHHNVDPGPLGHPGCRCVALSLRMSDTTGALPDARERFDALPEADQIAILGLRRLQLLRSGAIQWADLVVLRNTRNWRPSYVPRTVVALERIARTRTRT